MCDVKHDEAEADRAPALLDEQLAEIEAGRPGVTSHSRFDAAPYHTTAALIGASAANMSGYRPVWQ